MFRISSMEDGLKKAGIIYISALFRPVATVATTGVYEACAMFASDLCEGYISKNILHHEIKFHETQKAQKC